MKLTNKDLAEWFAAQPQNEEAKVFFHDGRCCLGREYAVRFLTSEDIETIENADDFDHLDGRPSIYDR